MERWREYSGVNALYRTLYKSLDTNSPLYKRHSLNNWLGFGLRKDDIALDPFMDRWERADRQTMSRFQWWLNGKFRPYINHGCTLSERRLNGEEIDLLIAYSINVLEKIEEIQGNGVGYVTTLEIRAAVVACAAARLFEFRDTPSVGLVEHDACQNQWYEYAQGLAQKLSAEGRRGSQELASAMLNLRAIIEKTNDRGGGLSGSRCEVPAVSRGDIREKSDRAKHGRTEFHGEMGGGKRAAEYPPSPSCDEVIETPKANTPEKGRIVETSDRAVHRRSETPEGPMRSPQTSFTPGSQSSQEIQAREKPNGSMSSVVGEPFDLIGADNRLLVDIGLLSGAEFRVVIPVGSRVPSSRSKRLELTRGTLQPIPIDLALRFGGQQILKVYFYQIDIVSLTSIVDSEVKVSVSVAQSAIQVRAVGVATGRECAVLRRP